LGVHDISDSDIGSDDAESEGNSQGNILGVGSVAERIAAQSAGPEISVRRLGALPPSQMR